MCQIVSRIRGIQEALIENQIDALSQLLFFNKHINKKVSSYSGGTKRKLSFAMVRARLDNEPSQVSAESVPTD